MAYDEKLATRVRLALAAALATEKKMMGGLCFMVRGHMCCLLIVCHCERDDGEVIRIISARKATQRESAFYQGS